MLFEKCMTASLTAPPPNETSLRILFLTTLFFVKR
jgi:hypothetical protein